MSALCVIDEVPATEGHLCTACSQRFRRVVCGAPDVLVDLMGVMSKEAVRTSDAGASSSETSFFFNLAASDAAAGIRQALRALVWVAEGSSRFVFDEDPVQLVDRVLAGWSVVCRSEQVRERALQLSDAVTAGRVAVDRVPERRVVGSCDCGAVLTVGSRQSEEVACRRCGVLWEVDDLTRMRAAQVEGYLQRFVTAREMSAMFSVMGKPVSASGIRNWIQRGQLKPRRDPSGEMRIWAEDAVQTWESIHGQQLLGVDAVA